MDYLFALQNIREACPKLIQIIFVIISEMVVYVGPMVPVVMYLCIDKRKGARMMFVFSLADTIGNTLKLAACVKRPWLRDSRLKPAEAVMGMTSTGYSFPSGHTCAAASIYGGTAQVVKKKWATITFSFLILLTAFARNFLGMHTFADVLAAIILTVIVGFISQFFFKLMENHPEYDIYVFIGGLALCIIACLYIGLKSYPLDLMDDGTYLYIKMQKDGFAAIGMLAAWVISWYSDRRFIKFSIEGSVRDKVHRAIGAAIVFCLFFFAITKPLFSGIDPRCAYFLERFISVLMTALVYPIVLKKFRKGKSKA